MNKLRLFSLSAPLLFTVLPYAYAGTGTEGASFLDIPVGAGPAALGSAYTAQATDAYAPIYNPAGLGFLKAPEIAAQHLSYLQSIDSEFGSVAVPLSRTPQPYSKALAASVQYLGSGDIAGTDPTGRPIGNFSAHYAAYTLSYGQKVMDNLSVGLSGKAIESKIADASGRAYAGDIGALYQLQRTLALAATVTNIGSKLNFGGEGDSLPTEFHFAAAYRPLSAWSFSLEGVQPTSGSLSGRFGGEWSPIQAVSLRAGYRTDTTKELSALAGFSTGVGIHLWSQEFAYAWLPYGDLGDTQYFSLLLRFGPPADDGHNLVEYPHATPQSARAFSDDQLMQALDDERNRQLPTRTPARGQS